MAGIGTTSLAFRRSETGVLVLAYLPKPNLTEFESKTPEGQKYKAEFVNHIYDALIQNVLEAQRTGVGVDICGKLHIFYPYLHQFPSDTSRADQVHASAVSLRTWVGTCGHP